MSVSEDLDSWVDGMMVRRRLVLLGWERGGVSGSLAFSRVFFWVSSFWFATLLGPAFIFFSFTSGMDLLGWDNGQGSLFGLWMGTTGGLLPMAREGRRKGSGRGGKEKGVVVFLFIFGLFFCAVISGRYFCLTRTCLDTKVCVDTLASFLLHFHLGLPVLEFCLSGCLLLLLGFTLAGWLSAVYPSVRLSRSISTTVCITNHTPPHNARFVPRSADWAQRRGRASFGSSPLPRLCHCPAHAMPGSSSCFALSAWLWRPGPPAQQGLEAHLGVVGPTRPTGRSGLAEMRAPDHAAAGPCAKRRGQPSSRPGWEPGGGRWGGRGGVG